MSNICKVIYILYCRPSPAIPANTRPPLRPREQSSEQLLVAAKTQKNIPSAAAGVSCGTARRRVPARIIEMIQVSNFIICHC